MPNTTTRNTVNQQLGVMIGLPLNFAPRLNPPPHPGLIDLFYQSMVFEIPTASYLTL